jgi:hypothetical protein
MGWHKGSWAALIALGTLLVFVWIGSYLRALNVHLPARADGCATNLVLYRGLMAITVVEAFPSRRAASVTLPDGRDRVRADCWDHAFWRTSYAGLSYADGLLWVADENGPGVSRRYHGFTLPLWILLVSCALVPLQRLYRNWRMNRRAALGRCRDCGYDLGGLKIDCPACLARTSLIGASSSVRALQPV